MKIASSLFLLLLGIIIASAQNAPTATPTPPPAPKLSALKEVAPGIYQYNGIRLDKVHGQISFPAKVNMAKGAIEYLLVNEKGKVHESLLSTKIMPHDIHVALLLIGLKLDPNTNLNEPVPPSAIDSDYLKSAPKMKGQAVEITVNWKDGAIAKEIPASDWIFNTQTNQPMTAGSWTYTGSIIEDGVFLADQDLSIAALITDSTALVNNPRIGYNDDEIWQVRETAVRPENTPVEIRITLDNSSPPKP